MMKNMFRAGFAGLIFIAVSPVNGQSSTAPLVVGTSEQPSNLLRAGTEVNLRTRTELNSRTTRTGQRFDLEVSDPVTLNGQIVIPAGSIAVGEVTRVRRKGMWGRRGILETRLLYVRVGDHQIRLNGAAGDRGRAGTAGVVASIVVIPVVGFFVTGTSAVLPSGTSTVGFTEEDVPVVFAGPVVLTMRKGRLSAMHSSWLPAAFVTV